MRDESFKHFGKEELVGKIAKGRVSKRVFQENKASQISRKTNISYHLHTHVRVRIRGLEMFVFRKIWHAFFLKHPL